MNRATLLRTKISTKAVPIIISAIIPSPTSKKTTTNTKKRKETNFKHRKGNRLSTVGKAKDIAEMLKTLQICLMMKQVKQAMMKTRISVMRRTGSLPQTVKRPCRTTTIEGRKEFDLYNVYYRESHAKGFLKRSKKTNIISKRKQNV